MISRRIILKGGAAAALMASVPFVNTRHAFAQSVLPFDYFISAKGDDNNAGSLTSPWSITALNSKMSLYAGKRIGIIGDQGVIQHGTVGGVQTTLYSLYQASDGNTPVLKTNGGTSSASTYIASCNSSGVYTARLAIIDFSNPVGGVSPTVSGFAIGQNSESAAQVPNVGYITFDGLTIRNFTFSAIALQNPGGSVLNGAVVQNCEIYNGGGVPSNNNPGAVRFWNTYGAVVHNNMIHDLRTITGGADPMWGHSAVMTYGSSSRSLALVITNNTFYNCSSILTKDFNSDFANCSYNYMDHGIFGSAGSGGDLAAGSIVGQTPYTGVTSVIHHNIMMANLDMRPQGGTPLVTGTMQFYNNTLYGSPSWSGASFQTMYCPTPGTGGAIQFYNNLVYAKNGYNTSPGSVFIATGYGLANATFNKNVYSSGINFTRTDSGGVSFGSWQSSTGVDQNSVVLSSSPFTGAPTTQVPSSFAVGSSAVIGGVTCGALDGSGPVGCNFGSGGPVPMAPALAVS